MKRLILVLSFLGATSLTYAKEVSYVSISQSLLAQEREDSQTEETLLVLNKDRIEVSDFWGSEQFHEWQKKQKKNKQRSKGRKYHDDDDDDDDDRKKRRYRKYDRDDDNDDDDDDDDDDRRRRYNKRYKKTR